MTTIQTPMTTGQSAAQRTIRVGCVEYLNTLPLIEGVHKLPGIELSPSVPSALADRLVAGETDIALASMIDYQRAATPLAILPAGIIGCDGSTMTVRLFARTDPSSARRIAVDRESHTSVALLRIIMGERGVNNLDITGFDARKGLPGDDSDAVLVIGDKVEAGAPWHEVFPISLDLGAEWKSLTGLPFVYAAWMCRAVDAEEPSIIEAARLLDRQRRHNTTRLEWIAASHAPAHNWPVDRALDYLANHIDYELTGRHAEAIDRLFRLAEEHGVIDERRPVAYARL